MKLLSPTFPGASVALATLKTRLEACKQEMAAGQVPADAVSVYGNYDIVSQVDQFAKTIQPVTGNTLGDVIVSTNAEMTRLTHEMEQNSKRLERMTPLAPLGIIGLIGGAFLGHGLGIACMVAGALGLGACFVVNQQGERMETRQGELERMGESLIKWGGALPSTTTPAPVAPPVLSSLTPDQKRRLAAELLAQADETPMPNGVHDDDQGVVVNGLALK